MNTRALVTHILAANGLDGSDRGLADAISYEIDEVKAARVAEAVPDVGYNVTARFSQLLEIDAAEVAVEIGHMADLMGLDRQLLETYSAPRASGRCNRTNRGANRGERF